MVRRQAADLAPGCLYWILDKCHLGSGPDRGRAGSAAAASRVQAPYLSHPTFTSTTWNRRFGNHKNRKKINTKGNENEQHQKREYLSSQIKPSLALRS